MLEDSEIADDYRFSERRRGHSWKVAIDADRPFCVPFREENSIELVA
jgi:hypothetical protein